MTQEIILNNERFNAELQMQIEGRLDAGHVYNLGKPGAVLKSTGFPDDYIELAASHLSYKSQQYHHPYEIGDVKDLVKAINDPIAVFVYGEVGKAQNVITEIEREGKKFVVGVHFNQSRRGSVVSDIRGLYNKDNAEWLNWISQGKLLYVNKEKIQNLIDKQQRTLTEVTYLDLDFVAKIIKNFENPKSLEEKSRYYYKVASPEYIRQASRVFDEELARQVKGKLEAGHVYQLGYPGELLQAAGFPDNRIELLASHLTKKSQQENHSDWLNWIQQGKMLYVNKEKVQNLMAEQRTNLAEVSHLDLNFITKVVKNFENPKFSMENVIIMDDYFDETKRHIATEEDSLQSRQWKARLEQAGIGTGSRFRVDRLCDFNDMEVKDIDLANGKMTFFHPTTHPDYQGEFERSIDRVLENIRMNQGSRWVQVDNDRKDIVIPAARQAVLDRAKDLSNHAAFSDSQVKSLERYCTLYSEKISKERILSSLVGDMGIVLREAGVSKDRIDDVFDELKQLAHGNRREKGKALENAWIFKRQDGDFFVKAQIDGRQMLSKKLSAGDAEDFKSGRKDKYALAAKYFARELERHQGKENTFKRQGV